MSISKHNPIGTVRCGLPECDEVIYRDTLDKDEGWIVNGMTHKHYCSEKCAAIALDQIEDEKQWREREAAKDARN